MKPIFRHYWWIAVVVAAGGGWAIHILAASEDRLTLVGALVTGTLGFCYFVQQQKLAETQLFKDLFTAFNERYDKLNDDLYDIQARKGAVDEAGRKRLIDYFNLCSEEFLFYQEGYIHPVVWRAWCRGVLSYLKAPHIRAVWDEEVERDKDSYYGLTADTLREGAGS